MQAKAIRLQVLKYYLPVISWLCSILYSLYFHDVPIPLCVNPVACIGLTPENIHVSV